jgi:selenocysteine-specific elongation factor
VLARFAAENPLVWGVDREELRAKAGLSAMPLFDYLLSRGKETGELFFRGGKVRAGSGELDLSGADRDLIERIGAEIERAGWQYPSFDDLAARVGGDRRRLERCLHILQEGGAAVKIARDGWIASSALGSMIEGVGSMLSGAGAMTVGDFKDRFGISRKFAVPLLEYLDSRGYTRRDGDRRLAGPALGER